MHHLNIIIVIHNETEYVKLSIESIRMFADIENLSVILVDNLSSNELEAWAMEQTDIVYIQNDEKSMPYGRIINQVCDLLELHGDLLLLDPHFMLTPHCLSRMMNTLYSEENVSAVGPVSNSFTYYQKNIDFVDYEKAVSWARQLLPADNQRVMELAAGCFLLREDTLTKLGPFEENVQNVSYTLKDYCFRMIESDFSLKVCKTAFLWDARNVPSLVFHNSLDEKSLETKWSMHYFNSVGNSDLVNMIHHSTSDFIHVLEIGCDCGATLLEIKNKYPQATVYGCEINTKAAQTASHFAEVISNNIEDCNLPYDKNMFDYIIFGDVLEHLHAPQKTLDYCKAFLKDSGCIIASIPNLMHISVIDELLKGNFTYTETGLLDKTHIHFFTYNEIMKMFDSCGFHISQISPVVFKLNEQQNNLVDQLTSIHNTPRFMYETFQYIVCAQISNK